MTPEQALEFLAACARKVLPIEQTQQYQQAIAALLPLAKSGMPVALPQGE